MGEPRPDLEVTPDIRLVRRLGKGGMGSVWLAHHARLNAEVVVKFLADRFAEDPAVRARFQREVAAAAQVRSPHVVQTFDHGMTEDGTPYIVMELLDGEDLAAVIKQKKRLEVREVAHVLDGLAAALTKAHERGIVHRDIKPANVFLCSGGKAWHVKLLDFGIAKVAEDQNLTQTGEMLGTPSYMSPEQFEGSRELDHRADVWALGILVYHALTGHTPFRGQTMVQVTAAVIAHNYVPPSVVRTDLPMGLDAWFAKACARRVDERFASVKELVEAFEAAVTTTPRDSATKIDAQIAPPVVTATAPHHSPPRGVAVPLASTSAPVIAPARPPLSSAPYVSAPHDGFDTTLRPATVGQESPIASRGARVLGVAFAISLALALVAVRFLPRLWAPEAARDAATATEPSVAPTAAAASGVPATASVEPGPPAIETVDPHGGPVVPVASPPSSASPTAIVSASPSASTTAPKRKVKRPRAGHGKADDEDVGF